MRISTNVRVPKLSVIILGTLMGTLGGFWLGRVVLLRTAGATLAAYAQELSHNADILSGEVNSIFLQMEEPPGPACSDQDLTVLRSQTFRTAHIKDIGRTHDGKVYCSAFLGRLEHPYVEGPPSLVLNTGANVYTHVAVVMDPKGGNSGTIVEAGDVDVVLNSNVFGSWDRPHLSYMVVAFNREIGRALQIAGSTLEVKPAWVLSNDSQTLRGSIYKKVCSTVYDVCAVTTERLADVWGSTISTQIAYSAMGGFAGLSLSLAMTLLYSKTKSLSNQLLSAVRKESPSLHLLYQPIMDVGTGRCMGAETLLRWTDQSGSPIPPDTFIPIAEEKGFIKELTAFVLRRATRELGALLRTREDFILSINIAASDLGDELFFQLLEEFVSSAGIRPEQIALELTERSTADLVLLGTAIQRLRVEGYRIYIDDFGVGFSSLSYIDQLRVNAIKVDRTFTRTIGTGAMIAPILSQMLEMASSLRLEVVVEGVEAQVQRDFLAASDKNLRAQGWFYSKPLTADALLLFETNNRVLFETNNSVMQESVGIQRQVAHTTG